MTSCRKTFTLLLFIAAVALACRSAPREGPEKETPGAITSPIPSPTPAPRRTPTPSATVPGLVEGDPKELIIQLEDLPSGFQMVAGEYGESHEYAVVYLRAEALIAEDPSAANLLGVVANLGIYGDDPAAIEQFRAQGSLDQESISGGMAAISDEVTVSDVQPYEVGLLGTDELIAFRVQYAIGSTPVVDYRYRFIVGNALANVIVSARAAETGEDPAAFPKQARAIVKQQVARLIEARHYE